VRQGRGIGYDEDMRNALLLCLALAGSAAARDAVVDKVAGPVAVLPQGGRRWLKLSGGEDLLYGDSIRVGKGGVAQVTLGDRGAVLLREETVMVLTGSPRRTMLWVEAGEFLIGLRQRLAKGASFRVRTPSSVAAVRGTLFWGKSDAAKTTTYAGLGHEIAVTANGKTVVVKAGQTTTVPLGAEPSAPKPHDITPAYLSNFAVDGGLQGLDELLETPK
jgi:hypothetical protein